jgi:hypothetical protein
MQSLTSCAGERSPHRRATTGEPGDLGNLRLEDFPRGTEPRGEAG